MQQARFRAGAGLPVAKGQAGACFQRCARRAGAHPFGSQPVGVIEVGDTARISRQVPASGVGRSFCSRKNLLLENLALRQQLMVFKRHNSRPKMRSLDKLFWMVTRGVWSQWREALVIVTPETVVRWH